MQAPGWLPGTGILRCRPGPAVPNTRYGLGVILRETPLGPTYGHSGFFPGYATEMLCLPELNIALAVQANITDPYPRGLVGLLISTARHLEAAGLAHRSHPD